MSSGATTSVPVLSGREILNSVLRRMFPDASKPDQSDRSELIKALDGDERIRLALGGLLGDVPAQARQVAETVKDVRAQDAALGNASRANQTDQAIRFTDAAVSGKGRVIDTMGRATERVIGAQGGADIGKIQAQSSGAVDAINATSRGTQDIIDTTGGWDLRKNDAMRETLAMAQNHDARIFDHASRIADNAMSTGTTRMGMLLNHDLAVNKMNKPGIGGKLIDFVTRAAPLFFL